MVGEHEIADPMGNDVVRQCRGRLLDRRGAGVGPVESEVGQGCCPDGHVHGNRRGKRIDEVLLTQSRIQHELKRVCRPAVAVGCGIPHKHGQDGLC